MNPSENSSATEGDNAISEAESAVMQALWQRDPPVALAAEDIVQAVAPARGWSEATVKTLLNRLLKKGAVSAKPDGRKYLYSPVLQRSDWLARESQGLLCRLFGGRIAPMVAHFGERGALSAEDVQDIKALIAQMEARSAT
jgi:BlaI family transcriptional regulator, penicillinase repressor